jgi:hypothetical protein
MGTVVAMARRRPLPRATMVALGLVMAAAYLMALAHTVTRLPDLGNGPHAAFPAVTVSALTTPVGLVHFPGVAHAVFTHAPAPVPTPPGALRPAPLATLAASDVRFGLTARGPPSA